MKKQSIKSLKAQIDKVKLDSFAVRDLKGGDYGYNLAYGLDRQNYHHARRIADRRAKKSFSSSVKTPDTTYETHT